MKAELRNGDRLTGYINHTQRWASCPASSRWPTQNQFKFCRLLSHIVLIGNFCVIGLLLMYYGFWFCVFMSFVSEECVYVCVCMWFLLSIFKFWCVCLVACLFSKERKKRHRVGWVKRWGDLGGVRGEETTIRIYCTGCFSVKIEKKKVTGLAENYTPNTHPGSCCCCFFSDGCFLRQNFVM